LDPRLEVRSAQAAHDEERPPLEDAEVERHDDVRAPQARAEARLALEAVAQLGAFDAQELYRDGRAVGRERLIDLAHLPRAEAAGDPVRADERARRELHVRSGPRARRWRRRAG